MARALWSEAAEAAGLKPSLKSGSVRLVPGTFTVDQSDVPELTRAGVEFDDDAESKKAVKRAYLDTVEFLASTGALGKRVSANPERQGEDNVTKYAVGWSKVMDTHQFWSKVNI